MPRAGKDDEKGAGAAAEGMEDEVVFWDLEYWHKLDTPHCLDQMHICKNVLESLITTLMNMPDKTKDGPKARKDLEDLNIRADFHMPPRKKLEEMETETEAREKKGKKVK